MLRKICEVPRASRSSGGLLHDARPPDGLRAKCPDAQLLGIALSHLLLEPGHPATAWRRELRSYLANACQERFVTLLLAAHEADEGRPGQSFRGTCPGLKPHRCIRMCRKSRGSNTRQTPLLIRAVIAFSASQASMTSSGTCVDLGGARRARPERTSWPACGSSPHC